MSTRTEAVIEWGVWPLDCHPDRDADADLFLVRVVWVGQDLYEVRSRSRYLTKGGLWSWDREDSYRTDEETAKERALNVVDGALVGDQTWAQLQETRRSATSKNP
jgi:hypothetical protein